LRRRLGSHQCHVDCSEFVSRDDLSLEPLLPLLLLLLLLRRRRRHRCVFEKNSVLVWCCFDNSNKVQ